MDNEAFDMEEEPHPVAKAAVVAHLAELESLACSWQDAELHFEIMALNERLGLPTHQ